MNITVYLGANEGNNPSLKRAVKELGTWIGKSGNALIYGGSKSGLMGALADSVLNAGGNVTGVEPQFFIENEFQHEGITKLIATKDMSERKNKMIELGNAFIAFPGGTGTLEEITEIMSKVSLKQLNAPCIVYNLNGYYDSLKAMLKHMIDMGLSSEERQKGIYFAESLEQITQWQCSLIQKNHIAKHRPQHGAFLIQSHLGGTSGNPGKPWNNSKAYNKCHHATCNRCSHAKSQHAKKDFSHPELFSFLLSISRIV